MKKKLLISTALILKAIFIIAQPNFITVGNYSPCDTCFIFTASDTMNPPPPYTYQWIFTHGTTHVTDTGKIVHYCSNFAALTSYADTLNLTITNGNGQHEYYFNTLPNLLPNLNNNLTIQPICIISVDTSINKNSIIWNQTTNTNIVSYNLYKETTTSGVYNLLANISRHSFSAYTDTSSHPDVKSARYRLTTVDTCGNESQPSASHKTMHLTINSGIPPAWNLIWESYDGLSFLKYRIWRKSVSNGWQLIDSVSSSSITYSDLTPPAGVLSYAIEILSPDSCSPSLKLSQVNSAYSSSLSNVASSTNTGINEYYLNSSISVFPNPVTDKFYVKELSNSKYEMEISLFDVYGTKVIEKIKSNSQQKEINVSGLSEGIYFVQIKTTEGLATKKIVVQK